MACQWNNYEIKRYHHTSIRILFLFLCVRWCCSHTFSQRDGSEFWMHYSFSSRWPSIQGPQLWFVRSSSWSFFVYIVFRLSPTPCTEVWKKGIQKVSLTKNCLPIVCFVLAKRLLQSGKCFCLPCVKCVHTSLLKVCISIVLYICRPPACVSCVTLCLLA